MLTKRLTYLLTYLSRVRLRTLRCRVFRYSLSSGRDVGCVVYHVTDNHVWLVTVHTDTVDGSLVTASVPVVGLLGFGWTRFSAAAEKQVSHSVDTAAGGITTVGTVKMYLSHATRV